MQHYKQLDLGELRELLSSMLEHVIEDDNSGGIISVNLVTALSDCNAIYSLLLCYSSL